MKQFYDFLGFTAFCSICSIAAFTFYAIIQGVTNRALTTAGFVDFLSLAVWVLLLNAIYEGFKRRK